MKKKVLLASIAAVISSGVVADEYPNFEAYLGGAFYTHDDDRALDDAFSLEGGVELPVNEVMSLEAWFSGYEVEGKYSTAELDAQRINPGLLFHLKRGDVRPFISAGFSHLEYETSAGVDHSESLINLGVGVKKYYDSNLILRGEILAMNSFDNEVLDLGARLAVGYAFGRSVSKPVMVEAPVIVSEKAAVTEPEKVMEKPEVTEPEKVMEKAPVKPAPVMQKEVVKDSDGDGIADSADKCANTNAAFKVDESGCPVMLTETVSIQMDVKFPSNSSILSKDYYPEIEKVAKFMQQFDKTTVTVEGHSDDRGNDAYNKTLSQRRADSVSKVLTEKYGLPAERVKSQGYGEEQPIADNATAEGRAANRRVVAVVESSVKKAVAK